MGRLGPLGILGGGQLGRMTAQAAADLGVDVVIAERGKGGSPAARIAWAEVPFQDSWDDPEALEGLARLASVVTLENEFVDAGVLRRLEALGIAVRPSPSCVAIVQDKLRQKQALADAGLPVPAFRAIADLDEDLELAGSALGWPLMLKARRDGYDGYGNALVRSLTEARQAAERLGWPRRALLAEALVPFERELAAIVVRGLDGATVVYPVVETVQDPKLHVCLEVLAPAPNLPLDIASAAAEIARAAVEAVDGTGTFGVEMFVLPSGDVLVNELAPRPHNSGHYTIEACATSQFANHVRAVLGLPLGKGSLRAPAAAMVNLLGQGGSPPDADALAAALRVPEAAVHLYGKAESRPGRKMGHVTALGGSLEEAITRAREAAAWLPT